MRERIAVLAAGACVVVAGMVGATAALAVRDSISLIGEPVFAAQVNFSLVTDAALPWVRNDCYQEGALVMSETHQMNALDGGPFQLGPTTLWIGGDAQCVAMLYVWKGNHRRTLATTEYEVTDGSG